MRTNRRSDFEPLWISTQVVHVSSQSSSAAAELLLRQGPSTTCDGDSKKILCLPPDYSKFDLPYRNDFNIIDIGMGAPLQFARI